eukprot:2559041-Pleurochrysis_carterae.AAC.2
MHSAHAAVHRVLSDAGGAQVAAAGADTTEGHRLPRHSQRLSHLCAAACPSLGLRRLRHHLRLWAAVHPRFAPTACG